MMKVGEEVLVKGVVNEIKDDGLVSVAVQSRYEIERKKIVSPKLEDVFPYDKNQLYMSFPIKFIGGEKAIYDNGQSFSFVQVKGVSKVEVEEGVKPTVFYRVSTDFTEEKGVVMETDLYTIDEFAERLREMK